ncbi:MAG TPA: asparaginase [Candidatus Sulfotelmatobacter sp.]|nr:asparaginase [Candidatus Sulfotelmatobacter sp.]
MPQAAADSSPIVHLLTMGGTIAATLEGSDGYTARLGAAALLPAHPALAGIAIRPADFTREQSFGVTFQTARRLVARLTELLAEPEVRGVAITHGTAVMEEVAYLCDLTLTSPKPVVFTGAMYHASDPGPDGPHNVADAIRVAVAPEARGRGAMVCFAGEIHAARDVMKLHKQSPSPYVSPGGPLGAIDAGGVIFYREATARTTLPFPPLPLPRVEVIKAVMDMDDMLLQAAIGAGAMGLVIEGFPGGGGVPPSLLPGLRQAVERGIATVLTARSPFGRMTPVAAGESGPRVLEKMGLLIAGDLPAHKARLLLVLALGNGRTLEELRALFAQVSRAGRIA